MYILIPWRQKVSHFNLSPVFCAHNGVVILEQTKMNIVIGMVDTENSALCSKINARYLQYLRMYEKKSIHKDEITSYITYKHITKDFFIRETSRKFALEQGERDVIAGNSLDKGENLEYLIEDAPIIHLLNSVLLDCVEKNGSDIHIEPYKDGSRIIMRFFGELELYSVVDKKTAKALILRILFLSGLDITETRKSQDGSFHFEVGTIEAEVRVSVLPAQYGISCVLRLLSCKAFELTFSGLGFSPLHIDFLENVCCKNNALILVCGATGAGKSTTLAAILHRLAEKKRKIITIEDPVEYRLDGAVQVSVNPDIDMDFSEVLRRSFRHDPDVLMIGEIRDEKTARIAVRAALTGHLVLASIHTIDAPSAVIRLLDMGIESWLLASVFGGSLCQKLSKGYRGMEHYYYPCVEVLPSCKDISNLILEKANVYKYRDWMEENGIESMHKEEVYASCF